MQPITGDQPIRGQHFSSLAVMLAVRFYLSGAFRYRAVGRILTHCASAFQGLQRPSFDSVRLWMLRIGLGRLLSASIGPRWLMICDHTATYDGVKMLVVCGVDLARLEQRVADGTGDFSLDHRDLRPLALVPMQHSSGQLLLEIFLQCIERHGNPERMVTDGGSDILKSARLLAEYQERRGGDSTKHTYDISHRIARIVEGELAPSAEWRQLEEFVTKARVYCKYRARHLSPPNLRHGPDRWMNISGIVGWLSCLKDRIMSAARGGPDQVANSINSYRQSPRFGFTGRIWEEAKKAYNKRDGVFNALKRMCGKEYPSRQAYEKELGARCPNLPGEVKEQLDANNDLNRIYLEDVSAGSEPCWAIHQEVVAMLAFSNAIQKHLKTAGLSKAGLKICRDIHEQSKLTGAGARVGAEIMGQFVIVGHWHGLGDFGSRPQFINRQFIDGNEVGTAVAEETQKTLRVVASRKCSLNPADAVIRQIGLAGRWREKVPWMKLLKLWRFCQPMKVSSSARPPRRMASFPAISR